MSYSITKWNVTADTWSNVSGTVSTQPLSPIGYLYSNNISLPLYNNASINRPISMSTPNGIGCLELVDTTDSMASPFRIMTNNGIKAIKAIPK